MPLVRSVVLLLLLCVSAAAFALTPTITSITPNVLPMEGDVISVETEGWASSECGSNCNLDVYIGGEKLPRSAIHFFGLTLTVSVPPQTTPGLKRFELHHPYGEPAIVENAILIDELESVLLPVGGSFPFATPGAFGSMWRTTTTVVNDSDHEIRIGVPFATPFTHVSPKPGQHVMLPAHATADLKVEAAMPLVVKIPRSLGSQVAFQTRVWDESRATTNFGTHVPSVRERDFATSRITIANVPTADPFRATLRVYSPDRVPRSFHVRVVSQPDQVALPEHSVAKAVTTIMELGTTTQFFEASTINPALPYSAPFSQMQIPFAGDAPVQLVIEPVDDGVAPFYAFVSVTNNETQHVTILAPR